MKHDRDSSVEHLMLTTDDGVRLEAELYTPADTRLGVVIAHPHPLHGGDMHSPVTTAIWDALEDLHIAGIRFNFRGVGASTGHHDGGHAEQRDVTAAARHLHEKLPPEAVIALTGWSFGADVSLAVSDVDGVAVAGWFLVAPPLRVVDAEAWQPAATSAGLKHLACPAHDQFRPPESAEEAVKGWTATEVHPVAGADHFLAGRTHLIVDQLREFVARV